jgi:hypothetical protein
LLNKESTDLKSKIRENPKQSLDQLNKSSPLNKFENEFVDKEEDDDDTPQASKKQAMSQVDFNGLTLQ